MSDSMVKRPDGCSLYRRDWAPASTTTLRGGIYLFHGLGEHVGRYDALAGWLVDRGWRVRGHDHRGHGRSDGARGALHAPDDLLDDGLAMLADFAADLGTPPVLLGHSMGGALAAQAVVAHHAPVRGLVLSSPALDPGMSGGQKTLAKVLNALAPNLGVNNGLDPTFVSRDPQQVQAYRSDPLVHAKITARLITWLIRAGLQAQSAAGTLAIDTLLLVAGADRLVDPAGSRRFADAAPRERLALRWYDGFYHELFNEPVAERAKVLDDLDGWLARR